MEKLKMVVEVLKRILYSNKYKYVRVRNSRVYDIDLSAEIQHFKNDQDNTNYVNAYYGEMLHPTAKSNHMTELSFNIKMQTDMHFDDNRIRYE